MNKKIVFALWSFAGILLLLFVLSFTRNMSKENRKAFRTALLNPKYDINEFLIYDNKNALEIKKNQNVWFVNLPDTPDNQIPADQNFVNNMLKDLKQVRDLYKVSDEITEKNNFGLADIQSFHIIYYDFPTDLIFGNHDFTENYRYFTSYNDSNEKFPVYEIDSEFDKYLTSSNIVWCEPYLLSKNISKQSSYTDVQRVTLSMFEEGQTKTYISDFNDEKWRNYVSSLIELRQGGFPVENELVEEILTIKVDYGNTARAELKIFSTIKDSEFLVKETYKTAEGVSYNYNVKISGWTLEKIKEIIS